MRERKTCCFFGHRQIADEKQLRERLFETIESLIVHSHVDTFLFGSRSDFDVLCREVVSKLKKKYTYIHRVYIRAEYQYINASYEKYLLQTCDETYYSERAVNAGKAVYVQRNYELIDKADVCVVYYKEGYLPPMRRNKKSVVADQPPSGTQIAYAYAQKKQKILINMFPKS